MKNIGTMQYKDLFWSYKAANWIGIIGAALIAWLLFNGNYQVTGDRVWSYWILFTTYLNWLAIALIPASLIEVFKKKLKGKQLLIRVGIVAFVWIVMLIISMPDNLFDLHVMHDGDAPIQQSVETVGGAKAVSAAGVASSTEIASNMGTSNSTAAQPKPVMQSASFDCRNAASPVEIAICTDPQLSDLDGRLALVYKQLLSHDPLARPEQRDWLQQRNRCGSNVSCLTLSYENRLKEIQAIQSESEKIEGQIQ